jgi:hypothetical protein
LSFSGKKQQILAKGQPVANPLESQIQPIESMGIYENQR